LRQFIFANLSLGVPCLIISKSLIPSAAPLLKSSFFRGTAYHKFSLTLPHRQKKRKHKRMVLVRMTFSIFFKFFIAEVPRRRPPQPRFDGPLTRGPENSARIKRALAINPCSPSNWLPKSKSQCRTFRLTAINKAGLFGDLSF